MSARRKLHLAIGPPPEVARWWDLLPSQRAAVIIALEREEARLSRLARQARMKAVRPAPYGKRQGERAFTHASNAGACRIARELLLNVGGHPE